MYAIIFCEVDNTLKPLLNEDKTLRLFEELVEANGEVNRLEENFKVEARVISIEAVQE